MKTTQQQKIKQEYLSVLDYLLSVYSNPKLKVNLKLSLISKTLIKKKILCSKVYSRMFDILKDSKLNDGEKLNYSYCIIIKEVRC